MSSQSERIGLELSPTWVTGGLCIVPHEGGYAARRATVEIRSGRVAALHDPGTAPRPAPGEPVVDATRHVVAPGFVNCHTHSPDNLIRGSAPDLPLELWSLHSAAGREERSPREITVAALLGAIEMLRTGTTTVLDHIRMSPHPTPEGLDAVAQAYARIGIRAMVAPIVADKPIVQTLPLDPHDIPAAGGGAYGRAPLMPWPEQLAIVEAFVGSWHGREGGRIRAAIGPSGPQRCSDALLEAAAELSERHGIILHSHVLETRAQRAMGFRLWGKGMVRSLAERGILSRRANLVHFIWLEDGDLDLVARYGAAVIHNPVSNARLGSGICRLPDMLSRGLRIGLGTDSACCNDSNNLLETAKWASMVHANVTPDFTDWVGPSRAFSLATRGGADVLGLGGETGAIAPGLAADLVLYRMDAPAFVPLIDPVRQLVHAENGASVDTVLVAGEVVLRDGRCTRVDEMALWEEAGDLARRRLEANRSIYAAASELAAPVERMLRRLQDGTHQ